MLRRVVGHLCPLTSSKHIDQPREGGAVTQPLTSGHGSGSLNRPIGNPSERYALENPGLSYGTVVDGSSRESNYERMEPSTSRTAYSASGVQGVSHGGDGSSTADRGFHNTPTAHQLDPRASDRSEGYSTLGSSSSRTAVDQPDFSTTTSMGTLSTGRARDTDGHTSYDRQRPVEDSTTSERLPGQRDTTSGPLGGIAQGGVARGINATGRVRPEHETEKTGVTGMHSDDAKFDVLNPSFANASSGAAEPSVGADPSSGQKSEQKQQGADRPHEVPSEEGLQAIREKKEAVEKTASGEGGANDLEKSGRGDVPGEQKSTEKGTGEKWVKSTGLAADGGDFDASKPGAGREADRT